MHPTLVVLGAVLIQLALVGVATYGQLSARLTGEEFALRVGTLDPIDPFRGAYVTLGYPDLPQRRAWNGFYDPELGVHFYHLAGDSVPNGEIWVYRYKRAPGR